MEIIGSDKNRIIPKVLLTKFYFSREITNIPYTHVIILKSQHNTTIYNNLWNNISSRLAPAANIILSW